MDNVLKAFGLKRRSDIHLARKIWHMAGVSFMALYYWYFPEIVSKITLTVAWILAVSMDYYRQKDPNFNQVILRYMKVFMRQNEFDKWAGTTYLTTGAMIVVFLFPPKIVLLTFWFLAFADPIASYFGIRFGRDKILGEKSLQGTLAAFVVCCFLTFFFLANQTMMTNRIVIVSLLGGVIGAVAELIPIGKLDDNLTLPVLSSIGLLAIFSIFA